MAVSRLVKKGEAAVPEVAPLLAHPDPSVRIAALEVLGRLKAKDQLEAVGALLVDANPEVRAMAAETLGKIGDPRAIPDLRKSLSDKDQSTRIHSTIALGWLEATEELPRFLDIICGRALPASERMAAIVAVGTMRAKDAVRPLIQIATDDTEQPKTRAAAVASLGEIGDQEAAVAVLSLLGISDSAVRFHVVGSLQVLGGSEAEEALVRVLRDSREEDFIRIRAAWAIGARSSSGGIQALQRAAREEREFIAFHAVRVLLISKLPGGREAAAELKKRSSDAFILSELQKLIGDNS
jgi:HEAT repeat protein